MTKSFFYFLLIVVLFSCSEEATQLSPPVNEIDTEIIKGVINKKLNQEGLERDYILYVPESYDGTTEVPLVFNFHGYTSSAQEQMNYGDFRPIADTANFIIVHPQGTLLDGSTHFNVGGWTIDSKVDDVAFTSILITTISSEYRIDQKRIYSTGMSNGGYMSFKLACKLNHRIAAVASVTGSMTPEIYNDCNPSRPVPIMQIHGTQDPIVPYVGNGWSKPIDDVMVYWREHNNCPDTSHVEVFPDVVESDNSTIESVSHFDGNDGSSVIHYIVRNGGHTWPGTRLDFPGTNKDINASERIWQFFNQYDINGIIQ